MDDEKKAVLGAALRAQERMIEYLQGVRVGLVEADRSKAELLLRACNETFDRWMATGRGVAGVAHSYKVH